MKVSSFSPTQAPFLVGFFLQLKEESGGNWKIRVHEICPAEKKIMEN